MNASDAQIIIRSIVMQQKMIIGPLAIEQAKNVNGLILSDDLTKIEIQKDPIQTITELVKQYELLFGDVSVEACKDSIRQVLSDIDPSQIPSFLK